jgi:hypothetical protein
VRGHQSHFASPLHSHALHAHCNSHTALHRTAPHRIAPHWTAHTAHSHSAKTNAAPASHHTRHLIFFTQLRALIYPPIPTYPSRCAALYRGAVSEVPKPHPAVEYRPPSKRRRTRSSAAAEAEDMSVLDVDGSMTVGLPAKPSGAEELWERPPTPPTVEQKEPWLFPLRIFKHQAKPPALPNKKEPTAVPAVEDPEPGVSYNPAYSEHQRLLRTALKRELDRAEAMAAVDRKLPAKRTPAQIGDALLKELSAGMLPANVLALGNVDGAANDEENDSDMLLDPEVAEAAAAVAAGLVPKKVIRAEDRKTKAQRNRVEKHLERVKKKQAQKLVRARESGVYQLRNIRKEISAQDAESMKRKEKLAVKEVRVSTLLLQHTHARLSNLSSHNHSSFSTRLVNKLSRTPLDRPTRIVANRSPPATFSFSHTSCAHSPSCCRPSRSWLRRSLARVTSACPRRCSS